MAGGTSPGRRGSPATIAGLKRGARCLPGCGESDCLVACGPGVEPIADEVARSVSRSADRGRHVRHLEHPRTGGPPGRGEFIAQAEGRAIDIIIGTQLVTKGSHFPELTLVGVVDADLGLEGGDLRAGGAHHTARIAQGRRAGPDAGPNRAKCWCRRATPMRPSSPRWQMVDRDAFYGRPEDRGRAANCAAPPPVRALGGVILSSEDEQEARQLAARLGDARPRLDDVARSNRPAPWPPLALLRGGAIAIAFWVKRPSAAPICKRCCTTGSGAVNFAPGLRVGVYIDPYSFV